MQRCSYVGIGELCEGDNECGASDRLNNCPFNFDVFLRVQCVGDFLQPPPPSPRPPPPSPLPPSSAPTPACSEYCDNRGGCGRCLSLVDPSGCPPSAVASVLPRCNTVDVGELCEGDGECGTSTTHDNCDYHEVYRRIECSGRYIVPPPPSPSPPPPKPPPYSTPPPACATACDNGGLCGRCLSLVTAAKCPSAIEAASMKSCRTYVSKGSYCEGDGFCGTSDEHANCGAYEIYERIDCSGAYLKPPPPSPSPPPPLPPGGFCSAHAACGTLDGLCCPTADGVMLDCCERSPPPPSPAAPVASPASPSRPALVVPAGNVAVVRFDAVLATDLASFDTAARAAYASGVAAMVGGGVVASDVSLQLAAASLRVTAVIRCRAADADARAIASRLESLSGPKLATALAPFVAVAVESVSSPSVAIVPKEGPVIPISDGPGHTPSALTRSDSASEERFTTVVTALSACVGLLLLALVAVLWGRGWFRRRCGRAKPGPTSSTTHRGVIGRPAPPLVVELVSPLPAVTPSYMGPSCTPTLGGPLGYGPCISERLSERGSFSERGSVADGAGGAAGSSGADASVESSPAVWAQYEEKGDEPTPPSYGSMREEEEPALPLALPGMAAVTLGGVPVPTAQGTFLHSFEGERGEPDVDGDGTMRI